MKNLTPGILAGLVATIVLSLLMLLKGMMGMMPELNVIKMLAGMLGGAVVSGWLAHFVIGIGYGVIFSLIDNKLPGGMTVQGIWLGVIGWLVMMIAVMPMVGAGLFGMQMGMMAPAMTLVLHIIFGAILGYTYGQLRLPA